MSELVIREDSNGLATLTLNRPEKPDMQERIAAFKTNARREA